MIHGLVYILCALTSFLSAALLWRGASANKNRLLLWSSLGFCAMAANNLLLYANFVIFPDVDLSTAARLSALVAVLLVNFGLVWHATQDRAMSPERIEQLNAFLNGLITMGHATAGLFFLRFWTRTRDRLFALFAGAFWLLGTARAAMAFQHPVADEHYLYWVRLIGYLMILAAIIDKNVKR